jgi:hypothetical protein
VYPTIHHWIEQQPMARTAGMNDARPLRRVE